jgi:hypothetical protein
MHAGMYALNLSSRSLRRVPNPYRIRTRMHTYIYTYIHRSRPVHAQEDRAGGGAEGRGGERRGLFTLCVNVCVRVCARHNGVSFVIDSSTSDRNRTHRCVQQGTYKYTHCMTQSHHTPYVQVELAKASFSRVRSASDSAEAGELGKALEGADEEGAWVDGSVGRRSGRGVGGGLVCRDGSIDR